MGNSEYIIFKLQDAIKWVGVDPVITTNLLQEAIYHIKILDRQIDKMSEECKSLQDSKFGSAIDHPTGDGR